MKVKRAPAADGTLIRDLAAVLAGEARDFSRHATADTWAAVRWHGIYSLIHAAAREGLVSGISEDLATALRRYARGFAIMDDAFRRQTERLLAAFSGADLPCLVIKGQAIAVLYYDHPRLRHRVDVDVLIPERRRTEAIDVLEHEGYLLQGHDRTRLTTAQFVATAPGPSPQPVKFDVHLQASNRAVFGAVLEFEAAWERRQALPGPGASAWAPDTIDLILHSCAHRLAHGRNAARERLLWLFDIQQMAATLSDEERQRLVELARARNVGGICGDALRVARDLFGSPYDAAWIEALEAQRKEEPSWALARSGKLAWYWSDLRGQRGAGDKLTYLKETLLNQLR
ncbi:MAG: nucleotidyltransferase family protein [Xanthomonadales bacterium]|nr:nucleotidyltransferase family protein [Xanthomonadales bacterium]